MAVFYNVFLFIPLGMYVVALFNLLRKVNLEGKLIKEVWDLMTIDSIF
ncbi:hypothetical protein ABIA69_000979 [Lysinibacillus parviboronicapiens]|uniref:Uncharacterized protein n=1 Tax=Lysinibacillus parviboronicapiens TaxID=436516 RepID=A0ABV2PGC7_9BACI